MTADEQPRARRRTHREARTTRSTAHHRQLRNPWGNATILSDDQIDHIHRNALVFLQEHGIAALLPEARTLFASVGATVDADSNLVRVPVEATEALLATAPRSFSIHTRNPDRVVHSGGNHLVAVPVAGPPYASDRDRGRRTGTIEAYNDFAKLTQRVDVLHSVTGTVEPQDVPLQFRHLHTSWASLVHTDKVPFFYSRGRGQVADALEMVRIANGVTPEQFVERAYTYTNINTNSPKQLDIPMSMGIIDAARAGQPCIMTPFTLAGAMAPVSLAGALQLQHIEAVAAIALSQIVRPGAPVVYGAFTSNVDMRSGAPAFGTPEAVKAAIASGQLARHIGVPWRSQGSSSSNVEDAQGATETFASLLGCLLGGANWVIHAAGWQEGGLVASYEKFVLDVEMLQIIAESMQPIDMGDAELALDAIAEVPPGGHFFGTAHTLERFETAFHEPAVFTRMNIGQWIEAGSEDAATRANRTWKHWLAEHVDPPIDDAVRAELAEFVARRTAEGGAPPES
jgi:trimethylamine--corrinoid protein Co-methyltransferase